MGSSSPVKSLPEGEAVSEEVATKEAELCFERGSIRQHQLHPAAPLQDSRCYIYRAVGRKELSNLHDLLSRLPERECGEVLALWDALMVARHDCEVMAARGVRVSRDLSRDWQETVSNLIDRVVAQDSELGQLRQQLKATQAAAAAAAATSSPAPGSVAGMEELHAQVVRLKRQRDRFMRDQQELSRALAEAQEAAALARHEAAAAKDKHAALGARARVLKDQHASLLHQHIELATYTESLEPATPDSLHLAVAGLAAEADQDKLDQACRSPGGSFIVVAATGGSGRRSPLAGPFPAGCTGLVLQEGAGLAAGGHVGAEVALAMAASRLSLASVLPSRSSSPIGSLPAKAAAAMAAAAAGEAAAGSNSSSRPRSSDDTPDRANDRIVSSTLAALSKEVERYDQQAQAVHQLQLNQPGMLAVGGWGERRRPDLRSTLEAAQLHLEL
ncbi:hypothetical protein COO60DRAFT_1553035 [Scenedesmus sp. NREL 46B-D3]|nr:hypothetical protein COO60DRAFT_1553035 [Scenedesmus sp. NREL 46B-D3]